MKSDYLFESIDVIGKKPMTMKPSEEVNVFKIRFFCVHNNDIKIDITTTAENYWSQGLLKKIETNKSHRFTFDIDV